MLVKGILLNLIWSTFLFFIKNKIIDNLVKSEKKEYTLFL